MLVPTKLGLSSGHHQMLSHIGKKSKFSVKTKPLFRRTPLLWTVLQVNTQRHELSVEVLRTSNYFLPHWHYLSEHVQSFQMQPRLSFHFFLLAAAAGFPRESTSLLSHKSRDNNYWLKDAHGQFIHFILLPILSLTLSSSSFTAVFTSLMYLESVVVSLLNLFSQHFNLSPCNYKFSFMHLLILSFCSPGDREQKLLIFKGKYREGYNCQEKCFKYTELIKKKF